MQRVLAITREERFSPDRIDADARVLDLAVENLEAGGVEVLRLRAEALAGAPAAALVLTMARSESSLQALEGRPALNSSAAIRLCNGRAVPLIEAGLLLAPPTRALSLAEAPTAEDCDAAAAGAWLKPVDLDSKVEGEVVHVASGDQLAEEMRGVRERGGTRALLQSDVAGTTFKFYAVPEVDFFGVFPVGSHEAVVDSRFDALRSLCSELPRRADLAIFGGDCILGDDGQTWVVDLNDWPSFAPCHEEAARAIADLARQRMPAKAAQRS